MTTDNTDYETREGGARIEELPASDMQLASEERERPSVLRAPPGEPDEPDMQSPTPRDPESEE